MGMTPHEYYDTFVLGNLSDCHDDPSSVRRAFNAAVAASHLADHFFNFNARHSPHVLSEFPTLGAFVENLVLKTEGAFRDIRSIANAYKHLYTDIDARRSVQSSVDSSGSLHTVQIPSDPNLLSVSAGPWEEKYVVIFTRKDGTTEEFLSALERVTSYWDRFIYDGA